MCLSLALHLNSNVCSSVACFPFDCDEWATVSFAFSIRDSQMNSKRRKKKYLEFFSSFGKRSVAINCKFIEICSCARCLNGRKKTKKKKSNSNEHLNFKFTAIHSNRRPEKYSNFVCRKTQHCQHSERRREEQKKREQNGRKIKNNVHLMVCRRFD